MPCEDHRTDWLSPSSMWNASTLSLARAYNSGVRARACNANVIQSEFDPTPAPMGCRACLMVEYINQVFWVANYLQCPSKKYRSLTSSKQNACLCWIFNKASCLSESDFISVRQCSLLVMFLARILGLLFFCQDNKVSMIWAIFFIWGFHIPFPGETDTNVCRSVTKKRERNKLHRIMKRGMKYENRDVAAEVS